MRRNKQKTIRPYTRFPSSALFGSQGAPTPTGQTPDFGPSTQSCRDEVQERATRRPDWSKTEDSILLGVLKDMVLVSKENDGHYTTEQWNQIAAEYQKRSKDPSTDKLHCQGRWKTLKKLYWLIVNLRKKSGWEWNNVNHMVIAPDDHAWDELIANSKEYKKVKHKSFPQWDDMDFLCGKNSASSNDVFRSTENGAEGQGNSASNGEEGAEEVRFQNLTENMIAEEDVRVVGGSNEFPEDVLAVGGIPAPASATQPEGPIGMTTGFGSSSGPKRPRRSVPSVSTTRQKNLIRKDLSPEMVDISQQCAQQGAKYLQNKAGDDGLKQEIVEYTRKMRAVPGMSPQFLVAGVEALRNKEDRAIVHALDGEELLIWVKHKWARDYADVDLQLRTQTANGGHVTQCIGHVHDYLGADSSQLEEEEDG